MDLYNLATIENVDLALNDFTKEELIDCILNFRTTYFRLKKEMETTIKCSDNTNELANEYKKRIDEAIKGINTNIFYEESESIESIVNRVNEKLKEIEDKLKGE